MAKTRHEGWMNIYPTKASEEDKRIIAYSGYIFKTKENAKMVGHPDAERIATVKVEWEE